MKNVLLSITTALLTVILCLAMTGCAGKLAGNTYVYDSYTLKYDKSDLSETEKKTIEGLVEAASLTFKFVKYEFVDDTTVKVSGVSGKYEQNGSEVTVNGIDKLTISGNKLKKSVKSDDGKYSYEVIYKKS